MFTLFFQSIMLLKYPMPGVIALTAAQGFQDFPGGFGI
jgi:hypothetical protein